MEFCHLIMTHRDPPQIARLVRAILSTSTNSWVLLLHDRKGCRLEDEPWLQDPRIVFLRSSVDVSRAEFSMVESFLLGLEYLMKCGRAWEWIVYLSGQDYPVRPVSMTEADLEQSEFDAYLSLWQVGGREDPWRPQQGRIRYHYRYRKLPAGMRPILRALKWTHSLQSWFRVFTTYGAHVGFRSRDIPFGPQLRLFGGSQWGYLRRSAVKYLLEFCRERADVVNHYRATISPDESLVVTVLGNASGLKVSFKNRRFAEFPRNSPAGHPRIVTVEDYPELCSGRYDFARKFDPAVDSRILDLLDARIAELSGASPDSPARGASR